MNKKLSMRKGAFFLCCSLCAANLFAKPDRPTSVDTKAKFSPQTKDQKEASWYLEDEVSGIKVRKKWNEKGLIQFQDVLYDHFQKFYSFENGMLRRKGQWRLVQDGNFARSNRKKILEFGKITKFDLNFKKANEKCYTILPKPKKADFLKKIDPSFLKTYGESAALEHYAQLNSPHSYVCGEEVEYSSDGSVKSRTQHPDKCLQGCGEFKPFMPPGKYKVRATNVVFRDKPGTKGKRLGVIQKGTELQVIEDAHKIETHDFETAPWVKVKYKGKTGYLFGGFLDSLDRNDL